MPESDQKPATADVPRPDANELSTVHESSNESTDEFSIFSQIIEGILNIDPIEADFDNPFQRMEAIIQMRQAQQCIQQINLFRTAERSQEEIQFLDNARQILVARMQTYTRRLSEQIAYNSSGTINIITLRIASIFQTLQPSIRAMNSKDTPILQEQLPALQMQDKLMYVQDSIRLADELETACINETRRQLTRCVRNVSSIPSALMDLTSAMEAQAFVNSLLSQSESITTFPELRPILQSSERFTEGSNELVNALGTMYQLEDSFLRSDPTLLLNTREIALDFLRQADALDQITSQLPDQELQRNVILLRNFGIRRYLQLTGVNGDSRRIAYLHRDIEREHILGTIYPAAIQRFFSRIDSDDQPSLPISHSVHQLEESNIISESTAMPRLLERFYRLTGATRVILAEREILPIDAAAIAAEIRLLMPTSVESSGRLEDFPLHILFWQMNTELRLKKDQLFKLFSNNSSYYEDYIPARTNLLILHENLEQFVTAVSRGQQGRRSVQIEGITPFTNLISKLLREVKQSLQEVPRYTHSQFWELNDLKMFILSRMSAKNRANFIQLWENACKEPQSISAIRQEIEKPEESKTGALTERIAVYREAPEKILNIVTVLGRQCLDTPGFEMLRAECAAQKNPANQLALEMYTELSQLDGREFGTSVLDSALHNEGVYFDNVAAASEDLLLNELLNKLRTSDPESTLIHKYNQYLLGKDAPVNKRTAVALDILKQYLRYDLRNAQPEEHYAHERRMLFHRALASNTSQSIVSGMNMVGINRTALPIVGIEQALLTGLGTVAQGINTLTNDALAGTQNDKQALYQNDTHEWLTYLAKTAAENRGVMVTSNYRTVNLTTVAEALGCAPNVREVSELIAPWVLAFQAKNFWNNLHNYANRNPDWLQQQDALARYDLTNDGNELPQKQYPCSFVLNGTTIDVWGPTTFVVKVRTLLTSEPSNEELKQGYVRVTVRPDDLDDERQFRGVLGRTIHRAIKNGTMQENAPLHFPVIDEPITDPTCSNIRLLKLNPIAPIFSTNNGREIRGIAISKQMAQLPINEMVARIKKQLETTELVGQVSKGADQTDLERDTAFSWITSADASTPLALHGLHPALLKKDLANYRVPMLGGLSQVNGACFLLIAGDHAVLDGAALGGVYGGVYAAFKHFKAIENRQLANQYQTACRHMLRFETNRHPLAESATDIPAISDPAICHAELPVGMNFGTLSESAAILTQVLRDPSILNAPDNIKSSNPELAKILHENAATAQQLYLAISALKDEYQHTYLDDRFITSLMTVTELGHDYERITNAIAAVRDMVGDDGIKTLLTEVIPKAKYGIGIFPSVTKLLHKHYRGTIAQSLEQFNSLFANIEAIVKAPLLTKIAAKEILLRSAGEDIPLSYATMKAGPYNLEMYEYDTRCVVCVEGSQTDSEGIDAEYIAKCFMEVASFTASRKIIQLGMTNSAFARVPGGIKPIIGSTDFVWRALKNNTGTQEFNPITPNQKRVNMTEGNNQFVVMEANGNITVSDLNGRNGEITSVHKSKGIPLPIGKRIGIGARVLGVSPEGLRLAITFPRNNEFSSASVRVLNKANRATVAVTSENKMLVLPPGKYKFFLDQVTHFSENDSKTTGSREIDVHVDAGGGFKMRLIDSKNSIGRPIFKDSEISVTFGRKNNSVAFIIPQGELLYHESRMGRVVPLQNGQAFTVEPEGLIIRREKPNGKIERILIQADTSIKGGDVEPTRCLTFTTLQ